MTLYFFKRFFFLGTLTARHKIPFPNSVYFQFIRTAPLRIKKLSEMD